MGMMSWLIPREKRFFELIEQQSKNVLEGVNALVNMLDDYTYLDVKRRKIKDFEEKGDKMVHDIFEELNKTFITPIDREDISNLTSSLDDILDYLEAVAERLVLYKIEKPPKYMIGFARTLQQAATDVHEGISNLKDFKNVNIIRKCCRDINTKENEGDTLLREAMADLFSGSDPIYIMKMKELYDNMETAIDKCEDAADVMGDILVKYT